MKESIKSCCMVCLLLVILFLVLAILYPFLNKKKNILMIENSIDVVVIWTGI